MNKRKHVIAVLCCVLLAVGAEPQAARSEPKESDILESGIIEIGRTNPFARLPKLEALVQRQLQAQKSAIELPEDMPDLFVKTVILKFLTAVDLQQAIVNMSSQYGSIVANSKNNSLIICDTMEKLDRILEQIRQADKTPQQILIEAVIEDVQLSDDTEIGVNWDLLSSDNYHQTYKQNFSLRLGSTAEDAASIGDASAFVTTGTGGDFSFISGTIRNVLHMLQQKKNVEILVSPSVMVLSGETASIEAIEEIPYRELTETSFGGELASVVFKEVGIKMTVTATLTDSNEIMLKVEPEQNINTAVFGIESIPIIDTRKAQTTLLLKDGEVVVMGGLRRKSSTKMRDQIPLLGDLPLIGFLFGRDKDVVKHSELIVFISPHIYRGEPPPQDHLDKYYEFKNSPSLVVPDPNAATKQVIKQAPVLRRQDHGLTALQGNTTETTED